ncbi:hypothetical protein B0H19DRAFT_109191 [Mycena capillaripes]|nr:hypothetical protein B0H19DRAFT_109191 [Mycena capillaripes]
MFNQSAGFQIYNSQLYNVGGDLNLRTQHHPTIQGHRAPGRSHTGFVLGIGASQQPLPIQDHEMRDVVLEPSGSADGRAGGFDHDFAGAARHTPHGSAARQALYDATLRPRSLGISNAPGPSLFNPRTFDVASHSGTFITAANVNFYGPKRRRGDMDDESLLTQREAKRRRQEEDGIKIIQSEDITLISEIGSGPGYFLHVGRNEGRATIIRVFNRSPTVRQQLESTVNLSKGLTHPNILRIKGISPRQSLMHFIAYENVYWKNAEGPLAAALKHDLNRSIALGFKMIAGFAAGMNYLSVQGLSLGSMGVENFDVFLDVDDRFLISINRRSPDASDESQESQENRSWHVFNGLCQKVLMSANRVIHVDCGQIFRHPEPLDSLRRDSTVESLVAAESSSVGCDPAKSTQEGDLPVQPRREYVWRTIDRGQQSLATVARQLTLDLDMNLSPLHRLTKLDRESPYVHRCAGYVREEITLATTTLDSAVVAHDAPSPLEICLICHEVVAFYEAFDCICGCYGVYRIMFNSNKCSLS